MTLQIREGKYYRDGAGRKIGPLRWSRGEACWYVAREIGQWHKDGRVKSGHGCRYPLVAEWDALDQYEEYATARAKANLPPVVEEMASLINPPEEAAVPADMINHPPHYTDHPSGVECIQITEHMNFCRGNAVKYIWRAGEKGDEIEDLKKARWYIDREISRLQNQH